MVGLWHFIWVMPWYGQALLGFGGLVGAVLLVRDRQRNWGRLTRFWEDMRSPPITPEHVLYLRQIAQRIDGSVQANREIEYGDPVRRAHFLSHFQGFAAHLNEWGPMRREEERAIEALGSWLRETVPPRCPDGEFMTPSIIQALFDYAQDCLRRGIQMSAPSIEVRDFMGDQAICWGMPNANTQRLVARSDASKAWLAERIEGSPWTDESRIRAIQGVFHDFVASTQWEAARVADENRKVLQQIICNEARKVLGNVRLHGRCDDCRSLRTNSLYETPRW